MSTAPVLPPRVKVEAVVPEEVRAWFDRRAANVYKSRSRYIGDLLVSIYKKEHPEQ